MKLKKGQMTYQETCGELPLDRCLSQLVTSFQAASLPDSHGHDCTMCLMRKSVQQSIFFSQTQHLGGSGEKSFSMNMEKYISTFKFAIISFCTLKPNPFGLGNCSVPNFCKTGLRCFCSLFTVTQDKFVPYSTGLFMPKKSKLLTREG